MDIGNNSIPWLFLQFGVLKTIGGTEGNTRGERVLQVVCETIFNSFINQITWTGRANKGMKKLALSKYANTVKLITELCLKADSRYSASECQNDIIYKVLKYAFKHKDSSSTSEVEPEAPSSNALTSTTAAAVTKPATTATTTKSAAATTPTTENVPNTHAPLHLAGQSMQGFVQPQFGTPMQVQMHGPMQVPRAAYGYQQQPYYQQNTIPFQNY